MVLYPVAALQEMTLVDLKPHLFSIIPFIMLS